MLGKLCVLSDLGEVWRTDRAARYSNTLLANLNARRPLDLKRDLESASTGTVLTDPNALSMGFWPEVSTRGIVSGDLSVQSGTTREPVNS